MAEVESFFFIGCLKVVRKVFFFFGVVVSKPERPSSYMSNVLKCSFFSPLHLIVETDWVCMCARVKQKKKKHWNPLKKTGSAISKTTIQVFKSVASMGIFFSTKTKISFTFVFKLKFYRIDVHCFKRGWSHRKVVVTN